MYSVGTVLAVLKDPLRDLNEILEVPDILKAESSVTIYVYRQSSVYIYYMYNIETPFTIKHILLHCVDFQISRDKYYKVNSLKE